VTNAVRGVEKRREGDRRFNSELMRIKEILGGVKQSGRVKEWRVTIGVPLAVSAVSSFVPV